MDAWAILVTVATFGSLLLFSFGGMVRPCSYTETVFWVYGSIHLVIAFMIYIKEGQPMVEDASVLFYANLVIMALVYSVALLLNRDSHKKSRV